MCCKPAPAVLGNLESGYKLSVLEYGLYKASNCTEQPLTRVDDTSTAVVGKRAAGTYRDVRIKLRTCSLYVIEALCKRHLGIMHVGTVVKHLDANTRTELRRQRLVFQLAAPYGLGRLTQQQ